MKYLYLTTLAIALSIGLSVVSGAVRANELGAGVYGVVDPTEWIQLDLGSGNEDVVNRYSFRAVFPDGSPKDWELKGSNDGSNWVTLHTVRDEPTPLGGGQKIEKSFENEIAYRYYRLEVTEWSGTNYNSVANLWLGYYDPQICISQVPAPEINLIASDEEIDPGGSTTLNCDLCQGEECFDSTSCSIDNGATCGGTITPTETTTYTLSCTDEEQFTPETLPRTAEATVTVRAPSVDISSDVTLVRPGEPFTLSWNPNEFSNISNPSDYACDLTPASQFAGVDASERKQQGEKTDVSQSAQITYTYTCTAAPGVFGTNESSDSVTVRILPTLQEI